MRLGLGLGLITAINAGGPGARKSLFPLFGPHVSLQEKLIRS